MTTGDAAAVGAGKEKQEEQKKPSREKFWKWLSIDNETDWSALARNLTNHRAQIMSALTELESVSDLSSKTAFDLAITDLITEKSVAHLSRRSTVYQRAAWILLVATIASIVVAILWFENHDISGFVVKIGATTGKEFFSNTQIVTMFLMRSVTMGALFTAAPAILGGLSFSYFHEATAAYHQRHLIRFGRLWAELQLSTSPPVRPEWKDFKQAFVFDVQHATAFRRLRMPKSFTGEAMELAAELAAKAIAKALEERFPEHHSRKGDEAPKPG